MKIISSIANNRLGLKNKKGDFFRYHQIVALPPQPTPACHVSILEGCFSPAQQEVPLTVFVETSSSYLLSSSHKNNELSEIFQKKIFT